MAYSQHNTKLNSLHNREECPRCHATFISGFTPDNKRECPSCNQTFVSGQRPASTVYSGLNNCHYKSGCPALMSDGRFITDYRPSHETTEALRKANGFTSHNDFRDYLHKNADKIQAADQSVFLRDNTCSPDKACGEGWYNLWAKNNGDWSNESSKPFFLQ